MAPKSSSRLKPTLDILISELANEYDGLVPRMNLTEAGHSDEAVQNRIARKTLVVVRRGVLRQAGIELTPFRLAAAAALVVPGSWISHTSALNHHGFTGASERVNRRPTLSSSHQHRMKGIVIHRHSEPMAGDLVWATGVQVSSPWKAMIESAAILKERDMAVALDWLVQYRRLTLPRLTKAIDAHGWFRGRELLQLLVNERVNGAGLLRSFLEFDLDKLLQSHRLPPSIRNYEVTLPDGTKRVLDRAWPSLRIGLEAESWEYHSSTSNWGRTVTRGRQLTVHNWRILGVVVEDVRNPSSLLADLKTVLDCAVVPL